MMINIVANIYVGYNIRQTLAPYEQSTISFKERVSEI